MRYLYFVICALSLLSACKRADKNSAANLPMGASLPADFNAFYDKFHTDSLYQIAHITWPLAGETTVQIDSSTTQKQITAWLLSAWRMHRPVDFAGGEFVRQVETIGDFMVMEVITLAKTPGIGFERRFARQPNGEWEMIYYADAFEFSAPDKQKAPTSPIEVKQGN